MSGFQSSKKRPILKLRNKCIGITLGDPSGIGPEVVAKALSHPSIQSLARYCLIGDYGVFRRYFRQSDQSFDFKDLKTINHSQLKLGQMNRLAGMASLSYLKKAIELIRLKKIDALVTAPVCKESMSLINSNFNGHTEFFAKEFKVKNVEMMFVADSWKVVILTRHIPLKKVSLSINVKNVYETIQSTDQALKKLFKMKKPVIGICGLNPHAGEGGLLGQEENQNIIPGIKKARKQGINAQGPLAADTIFISSSAQRFDAIIAMYHDQGLTPIKTLYFHHLVNLTIGLPFIRTSPSHGTAFDIVGKNKADPTSMEEAIKLAVSLSSKNPLLKSL